MTLRIQSKDGVWFVLNQPAMRSEAISFFFVDNMTPPPTTQELYSRNQDQVSRTGIDIGDTHWALARTAFAARPNLYNLIRNDVARQMAAAADRRDYSGAHPPWVPAGIWQQFLRAGAGVHRYPRASRLGTDIILINRDTVSGYAEMPTDQGRILRMLGGMPQSTLSRIFAGDSDEVRRARWMANANQGYNRYMWTAVNSLGQAAGEAQQNYRDAVYQRFLRAYLPLIGGSTAAHPGGAVMGDALRAVGWI